MDDQFAEWHSVRPWHPSLSLSVREITSVSVTFILSSPYSASDSTTADLASLGLSSSDDDDLSRDSISTADTTQSQVVSDILAKGLSVKVNGTPWQRVILKMDDVLDEAVIILYGLMPSRPYDVELGILPGEASVRGQITTDNEARTDAILPDSISEEVATDSPDSSSLPLSSSPPHTNGGTHSANGHTAPTAFTLEDRRLQLTHTLSLLTAEHTTLTSSLKSARRESQKADAALRSEIDTLKRASDRHAAGESRARKKVLALQEAVKQTLAAARDIEAVVKDIEVALPALEERKAAVEKEYVKVKCEAERVRARREEAEQREKARAEAMNAELAGLVNRLEKLNGKRERLEGEGGVLAELEEKLRKLEEERERVEKDPYGYDGDASASAAADEEVAGSRNRSKDSSPDGDSSRIQGSHPSHQNNLHPHPNFHPQQHANQRKRHSHPHMQHHPHQQHLPRPSFPPPHVRPLQSHAEPMHRPARASFPAGAVNVPGVIHLQPHMHQPHTQKAVHPAHNTHNAHSSHPGHLHPRPGFRAQGSSGSSSASSTPLTTPGGMLSSRAPPFEPGRSRAHSQSHAPGQGPGQGQAQGGQASAAVRSELNPGSTPFSPRTNVAAAAPGRSSAAAA